MKDIKIIIYYKTDINESWNDLKFLVKETSVRNIVEPFEECFKRDVFKALRIEYITLG